LGIYTKYVVNNAGFISQVDEDDDNNEYKTSSCGSSAFEDYQREVQENLRDLGVKFPGDPDER
jgi:hypothetical protein